MISEFETYHGVVLRDIVVCAEDVRIAKHDFGGRVNCFQLDGRLGLCVKHSTARLTPWVFTYNQEQMQEIGRAAEDCEDFWLAHVCGRDGVMVMSLPEFATINPPDSLATKFVRVDKSRNTMYRVFGTGGELPLRKSRGVGALVAALEALS
jgi:hypothetical protein